MTADQPGALEPPSILSRISLDWWATIIGGVIALLAVANVLPKIPW